MNVLALIYRNSVVAYHRIELPIRYMPWKMGDSIMLRSNEQSLVEDDFRNKDIVLFSRNCPFDLDTILRFRDKYGFKIVVDIDDYWHLPAGHIGFGAWINDGTSFKVIRAIKSADLVTTTHELLRKRIEPFNDNVHILPNGFPFGREQFTEAWSSHPNILYSAGDTHLGDLRSIGKALQLCSYDKEVQEYSFCVAGKSQVNESTVNLWKKMDKAASIYGNYQMWYRTSIAMYMGHYKMSSIAIAPLEENEFNMCKSPLKALEAGCKNIPLLASAIHPYTEVPVIHCKTQQDWYNNIRELIKRPEIAFEKGRILGNYVRMEYDLIKINEKRKFLYEQLGANIALSRDEQPAV